MKWKDKYEKNGWNGPRASTYIYLIHIYTEMYTKVLGNGNNYIS